MMGMLAIAERELRKFFHSPLLLGVALIGPLVQLLLMGNAFGGKVTRSPVGVVDLDGGSQSVRLREAFQAVAANADTFRTVPLADEAEAKGAVAQGRLKAAVIIPAHFTRRVLRDEAPRIGLLLETRTPSSAVASAGRCRKSSTP
ncbi:ABC transporter permease [Mesoterricola silvestris]|uniref:ABC-2 type transporter transmembrane domain-containing protein n=1 Tax=Mesoterricola silvestris TaxID=2927979 RepID=A0AA48KCJ3_9BACT|nr:ABC transporter permease [Mesoterricola silvestris]BDU73568.1 hypothetical protein METEAL_27420 [Mesoterricola silvestris]